MSRPGRSPEDDEQERRERQLAALELRQLREDVRTVLADPVGRRVVWTFLQAMGVDISAFNTNAMAQSRAIGRQEAAQWWLLAIRDNCPEREAQMRAEANNQLKRLLSQLQQPEETNDVD
ncbi:hypothetical protein GTY70_02635 [Stenotrophomonas maltophilia]|uniref:hypothetical protein n=1 Tax=Stenotrophomonas pavanii TaxID=487698 RepID=UPI001F448545|nr:hypothetical protein [Stenotrophomonas pavanii]MCF3462778.1 hypothetical protein [Stenotrophomonas maltophilia]MCF3482636.1 hypothetical protein [Stenotrophomonas maltophilia]MCF3507295.1 hypothetical protein [Stenotrophomonas maltophilia]